MDNTKKVLKTASGILLAILAIYLGKAFVIYMALSFSGRVAFLILPFYLAYLYMAIGLLRLKKWAFQMFFTIVLSAFFMEVVYIITTGVRGIFLEFLFHFVFCLEPSVKMAFRNLIICFLDIVQCLNIES